MSAAEQITPKKSKLPLMLGLILAIALGAGGFFAVYSGVLGGDPGAPETGHVAASPAAPLPKITFVALQPLLVSLNHSDPPRQLRFEGHLEVVPAHAAEVQTMMPRIMDVMNSYLRAVEMQDLRDPAALLRIRAQMLRRVQVVAGEGRVNDLLVTTFLVN